MVDLLDRIYDIDKNIFKNLESPNIKNDRGFYSTNILNELRNLAEHTALYIWQKIDKTIEFNKDNILKAPKQMSNIRNCKFIYKFHEILQVSVSHYTNSEDFSERLMLKYH
nr:hypothetical protein [Campylobacter sp.]